MNYNFIISFSSKYSSLIGIFMPLFLKNTSGLDKNIYISLDEEVPITFEYDDIYISKEETLPTKIKHIAEKHPDEVYICLLGDAFITKRADMHVLFNELMKQKFNYCNLMPKGAKKIRKNSIIKKIKTKQRYGVSFIAFAATYAFITSEFNGISDYDFEINYLKKSYETKDKFFGGMYMLNTDLLGIVHGISNGKWNRKAYATISKNNVITSNDIPVQTIRDYFFDNLANFSSLLVPLRLRFFLKKMLIKFGFKFKTGY